jgi:hypothetical protein
MAKCCVYHHETRQCREPEMQPYDRVFFLPVCMLPITSLILRSEEVIQFACGHWKIHLCNYYMTRILVLHLSPCKNVIRLQVSNIENLKVMHVHIILICQSFIFTKMFMFNVVWLQAFYQNFTAAKDFVSIFFLYLKPLLSLIAVYRLKVEQLLTTQSIGLALLQCT